MTIVDRDQVPMAKGFAIAAHRRQKYDGGPYWLNHLQKVEDVLTDWVSSRELRAAAWLHDVLEDTAVTEAELRLVFDPAVVNLVVAVTDAFGDNRAERKAKTFPKIRAAGPDAIRLKLADRIANVRAARKSETTKYLDMYRQEQPEFYRALYVASDGNVGLWAVLEKELAP